MTIADAPLWAQTPTGEIVRHIAWSRANEGASEPFHVDLLWSDSSEPWEPENWGPLFGLRIPEGLYAEEVKRLWDALGDLLAIEAVSPATTHVSPEPWHVDTDGSRSRFKYTPTVSTGAVCDDDKPIDVRVELWDDVDHPGRPDITDAASISLMIDDGRAIDLKSAADARRLAFALLKAARVAEVAAGVAHD